MQNLLRQQTQERKLGMDLGKWKNPAPLGKSIEMR